MTKKRRRCCRITRPNSLLSLAKALKSVSWAAVPLAGIVSTHTRIVRGRISNLVIKLCNNCMKERQRHRNVGRETDIEYITEMILLMGLQRHLNRGGRERGTRQPRPWEDDDDVDIFLSDIMSALMGDEDEDYIEHVD